MDVFDLESLKTILFLKFCDYKYIPKIETNGIEGYIAHFTLDKTADVKDHPANNEFIRDASLAFSYMEMNNIYIDKIYNKSFIYYNGEYFFKDFRRAIMFSKKSLKEVVEEYDDELYISESNIPVRIIQRIPRSKDTEQRRKFKRIAEKTLEKHFPREKFIIRFMMGFYDFMEEQHGIEEIHFACIIAVVLAYFTNNKSILSDIFLTRDGKFDIKEAKGAFIDILQATDFKCIYDTEEEELTKTPNYEGFEKLGEGTYGTVGIAKDIVGVPVCMKKTSLSDYTLQEEIEMTKKARSPHVIEIYDYDKKDENWFTMECMKVDLAKAISKNMINDIPYLMKELLIGMKEFHAKGVIHLDIKPQNILLGFNNEVKYTDFGIAENTGTKLKYSAYTLWYRPPEIIFKDGPYIVNEKMDIWALGCVFAEIYNKKPIFPGQNVMDQALKIFEVLGTPNNTHFNLWPQWSAKDIGKEFNIDKQYVSLIEEMLIKDPDARISSSVALEKYF